MTDTKKTAVNPLAEALVPTVNRYKEEAKIYDETHRVVHQPLYTEKVTEESLTEHINFIRDNVTAAGVATSELVYEKVKETNDPHDWHGVLDLPGIHSEVVIHPREGFHNPETGKNENEFGHNDIILDFQFGDAHTEVFENQHALDKQRYADLFSDKD